MIKDMDNIKSFFCPVRDIMLVENANPHVLSVPYGTECKRIRRIHIFIAMKQYNAPFDPFEVEQMGCKIIAINMRPVGSKMVKELLLAKMVKTNK
jgi:hypothetical protein